MAIRPSPAAWQIYVPKLYTVLQRGYGLVIAEVPDFARAGGRTLARRA